jgi:uncharacterized membrane protein
MNLFFGYLLYSLLGLCCLVFILVFFYKVIFFLQSKKKPKIQSKKK